MRQLPSATPHHSGQEVSPPAGVEQLLVEVVADRFVLHCCGPKAAPHALVACHEWDHYLDLLTIRDFDRVTTARVPTQVCRVDIFAPEVVVWAYQGPPQQALRALLHLVHPAHLDAPTAGYLAPASLHVPRAQQRPMTIQPPTPSRAGVRAARLATAMTAHGSDRAHQRRHAWQDTRSPAGRRLSGAAPDAQLPATSRSPATPRGGGAPMRFECYDHLISLRPHLVRVLDEAPDGC